MGPQTTAHLPFYFLLGQMIKFWDWPISDPGNTQLCVLKQHTRMNQIIGSCFMMKSKMNKSDCDQVAGVWVSSPCSQLLVQLDWISVLLELWHHELNLSRSCHKHVSKSLNQDRTLNQAVVHLPLTQMTHLSDKCKQTFFSLWFVAVAGGATA